MKIAPMTQRRHKAQCLMNGFIKPGTEVIKKLSISKTLIMGFILSLLSSQK